MRSRVWVGAALTVAVVTSTPTLAQEKKEQMFLTKAIEGNLAEVKMGQLAQKNGASQGVRMFGQMLETDHSEANKKAEEAAAALHIKVPTQPDSEQKADFEHLSKLNGTMFDVEFVKHMIEDHEKDIKEYETASSMPDAAGTYAKESLPTLERHLRTAQSILPEATTGAGHR